MGLTEFERRKDEKINGVVYDMLPAPGYGHYIINVNLFRYLKNARTGAVKKQYMEKNSSRMVRVISPSTLLFCLFTAQFEHGVLLSC